MDDRTSSTLMDGAAGGASGFDAADAADAILAAFERWHADFRAVTRRARGRFLRREWREAQGDAEERLGLYSTAVAAAVEEVRGRIAPPEGKREHVAKVRYAVDVEDRPDAELARTFFNSVVRRALGTVGVDARAEFTADDGCDGQATEAPCLPYPCCGVDADLFARVFRDCALADAFASVEGDAEICAEAARRQLGEEAGEVRAAEMLPSPFYRNKCAYLVGRLRLASGELRPLAVPLLHFDGGVRPDAVLTDADEVHVVFSFARSYFQVDTDRPGGVVAFLKSIMPAKPVHELYTSIGHNRHGKTELYRELVRLLAAPEARFEPAEGIKGLVMTVFTLPAYNVVFKVIKDAFGAPKEITRQKVKDRYRLVFNLDRVGRLVDAQEFESLEFPLSHFTGEALDELLREAPSVVRVDEDDCVTVGHLYTERRLRPLDLYLREAGPEAARAAILDYGQAIKDLAAANIFPGDLLLKNFGVSRHGRVIFYDYDELVLLTDVRFRAIPKARHEEDEMGGDAWFSVSEGDVFPEEFLPFLVPAGRLREAFLEAHADLLTPAFWQEMQRRQNSGELPDFFPYPQSRRLHGNEDTGRRDRDS